MAIVNFSFSRNEAPADAIGVHYSAGYPYWPKDGSPMICAEGPQVYWTWKTHVGLCLSEREMNGYNDSDFFMTVWDEEKNEPREIMFATTRGWTYPSLGSSIDATDEVKAKYNEWNAKRNAELTKKHRHNVALDLVAMRAEIRRVIGHGDAFVRALRLRRAIGDAQFNALLKFMGSRLKNEFRKSLQRQCRDWFDGKSKYDKPLSPKQMQYV